MPRFVALLARGGTWGVARVGKPYKLVAQGLTEAEARAKALELAR